MNNHRIYQVLALKFALYIESFNNFFAHIIFPFSHLKVCRKVQGWTKAISDCSFKWPYFLWLLFVDSRFSCHFLAFCIQFLHLSVTNLVALFFPSFCVFKIEDYFTSSIIAEYEVLQKLFKNRNMYAFLLRNSYLIGFSQLPVCLSNCCYVIIFMRIAQIFSIKVKNLFNL